MLRKWGLGFLLLATLVAPSFAACPNKCSGHGKCGSSDVCDCMQNWTGGDCSMRMCTYARAWSDTAAGTDDAHYYAECANRGTCDRDKGLCTCDTGFTGSGCRRMACPSDCSGHGTCEFIEDLAGNSFDKRVAGTQNTKYTLWDQEKIMGCACDPWYEGHDCSLRVCPKGDDPLTEGQTEMVQAIVMTSSAASTAVTGYLTYFDPYGSAYVTPAISFDPTSAATSATACAAVQTALNKLPNNALNTVTVTAATSVYQFIRDSPTATTGTVKAPVADTTSTVMCLVTFKSEPGTTGLQNLLECNVMPHTTVGMLPLSVGNTGATCVVYEAHPSSTVTVDTASVSRPLSELSPCSGRGACDPTTGTCKCFSGHMGLACQKMEALV